MSVRLCMQQQSLLLRLIKQYFSISGECVVYVCVHIYTCACVYACGQVMNLGACLLYISTCIMCVMCEYTEFPAIQANIAH